MANDEFQDHGVTLKSAAKVVIYKDGWIVSKPWHADVVWDDGTVWKGWQAFFRTRKSLAENARAALDCAGMYDAQIVYR